jgi:hypothetical protein
MLYVAVTRFGYISRAGSAIDNQLNRFECSTESHPALSLQCKLQQLVAAQSG